MKKALGDIIILHMCTINDNHLMYSSWNMEGDGQNLLSFWTVFCSFTPLKTRKIKIFIKWKTHLKIPSFYANAKKNHDHMLHCFWDWLHDRYNSYFLFWANFTVLLCYFFTPKNQKLKKMTKTPGNIMIFHFIHVY